MGFQYERRNLFIFVECLSATQAIITQALGLILLYFSYFTKKLSSNIKQLNNVCFLSLHSVWPFLNINVEVVNY